MTEQELRQMVRDSIARSRGGQASSRAPLAADPGVSLHASHGRLPLARGADDDGACLIEPAVRCNLCGFCQSYGH
jgi:hypothetical protein